jgi:hypothetical protein
VEWITVDRNPDIPLKKKKIELLFRVINLAGVAGPEHSIVIDIQ